MYLYRTQLSGTLDPAFANWTQLSQLDLSNTQLSGTLDPALASWTQLSVSYLYSTQLSGVLDRAFASWTQLSVLHLYGTQLSGTLDPAFASWTQLSGLGLYGTQLSGTLDRAFASWTQMLGLGLSSTQLSGTLDRAFASWAQLSGLAVYGTQLSGTLDRGFASWTQLSGLGLYSTQLSGTLDGAFASWTQLSALVLSSTQLSGTLHRAFANWTQLSELSLSSTQLSGTLDSAFTSWTRLVRLGLYSTQLSGTLDGSFASWMQLVRLGLYSTRLSGTLDGAFATWTQLAELVVSSIQLSGSLDPAFANWTQLSGLDLSSTQLSGTLDGSFASWTRLSRLDLSSTQLSGSLDRAFANWTQMAELIISSTQLSGTLDRTFTSWMQLSRLDLSRSRLQGSLGSSFTAWQKLNRLSIACTNISRVSKELYALPNVQSLDLSNSSIRFPGDDCPEVITAAALDLSGNLWNVPLRTALLCLVKPNSSLAELSLRDMGLTGPLISDSPLGSISRLRIDGNPVSCDPRFSLYGLKTILAELSSSMTKLASCYSLDLSPVAALDASWTNVTYCYDGAAISSPTLSVLTVRGVRPSPTCNRAKERDALTSTFSVCSERGTGCGAIATRNASGGLSSTLCRLPNKVVFADSNLTCPSWSTSPSAGSARLNVDAAFLSFWGCTCPPDHFWGLASLDALDEETATLGPEMSIGQREEVLERRACLHCPNDLSISCSPLATARPPHVVTKSVYPFLPGGGVPLRSRLPYLPRDALVACLHPAVCGGPSVLADDWDQWTPSGPLDAAPEYGDAFMCREGHDAESPLCATCVPGFWLDGFLCRRCFRGVEALVALGLLFGLVLLVYVLLRHHLAASGMHHMYNYAPIVLWYFQVSQALQLSAQINAAQAGDALAVQSSSLSDLLPVLSFRPWALECLSRAWDYRASSVLLLGLPWAVAAVGLALPSCRRVSVFALDLLFLPVAQRAVQWLNQRALPHGQVGPAVPPDAGADSSWAAVRPAAAPCHAVQRRHDGVCSADIRRVYGGANGVGVGGAGKGFMQSPV
jgi:hypothetical protein